MRSSSRARRGATWCRAARCPARRRSAVRTADARSLVPLRGVLTAAVGGPGLLAEPDRQIGARIPDLREVHRARPRAELVEHRVVAVLAAPLHVERLVMVEPPELDRPGRARLLARRHHLAGADVAPLLARGDVGGADPLHAVRALLHHAAAADGDARVVLELPRARRPFGEVEPVEPPDLVRAVVRAEPRADAAVVDHLVEPVGAVLGRVDRTDVLAGRVRAVLAQHRLVDEPRIIGAAGA